MKNRNTKRIILVLLILLVLTGMGYLTLKNQYLSSMSEEDKQKVEVLQQEVKEIEQSVNELDALFESSSQELGRRNELLKEKYAEINLLSERIEQLKRSGNAKDERIRELEEKLSKARAAILEAFVAESEALRQENQLLRDTLVVLKTNMPSEEMLASLATPRRVVDTVTVQTTETTVREATAEEMRLRASSFVFYNMDKNGDGEAGKEFKLKQVNDLRFCFDLQPNVAAEKKIREIYVVYNNPSGTVQHATGYSGKFALGGEIINYTTKTTVNYRGEKMEICIPYSPNKIPLEPGVQTITVYNDGNVIGEQRFTLK